MKTIKKLCLSLLLLLPTLLSPVLTFAQDDQAMMNWIAQAPVTLIGDSLSEGLQQVGWDSYFQSGVSDAMNSRWLYYPNAQNEYDGLTTLNQLAAQGAVGSILVINLGTNGGFDEGTLEAYLSYVPSHVQQIALVTTASNVGHRDSTNQAIRNVANKYTNVSVIDWDQYARQTGWENYYGGGDGIHLTDYGSYLSFIATTLYNLYGNTQVAYTPQPQQHHQINPSVAAPQPQAFSDAGWEAYRHEIMNMNVRAVEPEWMTAEWLEELFLYYPEHELHGTADIWLEMGDKYALNVGVLLAQALKESSWGRNGCPVGQSPYNFGCVVYSPSLAQQFGLGATGYVAGRQWMMVDDKRKGIELMFYVYDNISRNMAGSNRYIDILNYYSPAYENDHDTFMNYMYGVNVVMMSRDITEQREKVYGGGAQNYSGNGGPTYALGVQTGSVQVSQVGDQNYQQYLNTSQPPIGSTSQRSNASNLPPIGQNPDHQGWLHQDNRPPLSGNDLSLKFTAQRLIAGTMTLQASQPNDLKVGRASLGPVRALVDPKLNSL